MKRKYFKFVQLLIFFMKSAYLIEDERRRLEEPHMTFNKWLDKFIAENAIDTEQILTVIGPSGENHVPIARVIEAIKSSPVNEQDEIREMFKTGESDFRKTFMAFVYYMANIMAV